MPDVDLAPLRSALEHVERTFEPSADGDALVLALADAVVATGWRPPANIAGDPLTYDQFDALAQLTYRAHQGRGPGGTWRLGQAYANTLFHVRPDLADRLESRTAGGIANAAFYRDELLPKFLNAVRALWDEVPSNG